MNKLETNYRIVFPADGKYGRKPEKSLRWNGMMGMVLDNVSNPNKIIEIICKNSKKNSLDNIVYFNS